MSNRCCLAFLSMSMPTGFVLSQPIAKLASNALFPRKLVNRADGLSMANYFLVSSGSCPLMRLHGVCKEKGKLLSNLVEPVLHCKRVRQEIFLSSLKCLRNIGGFPKMNYVP